MRTIGSVLDKHNGIGPGFNSLRVVLALAIVVVHSVPAALGEEANERFFAGPGGVLAIALLPGFFALSGFLVMGSALRTPSLRGFLGLRALRIVPALATEITLSALILGPLFSTVSLGHYVTDHRFLEYFGSLVGRIRVTLPGVFEDNPLPDIVNISLWTIRPELGCYVYLALLLLLKRVRSVPVLLTVAILTGIGNVAADIALGLQQVDPNAFEPRLLLFCFMLGNLMFVLRHRIPFHPALFALCLLATFATTHNPALSTLSAIVVCYVTIWLGMVRLPEIPVLSRGDYSYGIYLYGFPVQQAMSHFFPGLRTPAWNLALALPPILGLAMFSWHFIEKPTLQLRKRLSGMREQAPVSAATFTALLVALAGYEMFLIDPAEGMGRYEQILHAAAIGCAVVAGLAAALLAWRDHRRQASLPMKVAANRVS